MPTAVVWSARRGVGLGEWGCQAARRGALGGTGGVRQKAKLAVCALPAR